MKKDLNSLKWLTLAVIFTVFACRKSVTDTPVPPQQPPPQNPQDSTQPAKKADTTSTPAAPFPQQPLTGCTYDPNYGDSIIYPQPTSGQDYIVHPINVPGPGKFLAWPAGLVIDSVTGAIDVTKSETGERFAIGFVKAGTTDTCLSNLIIGGGSYMDSVYVLADGQTAAYPYYDANPTLTTICGTGNGNGTGCAFDVTGSAAMMKVVVNHSTGVIDLDKTLNGPGGLLSSGAFGLVPLNGQTVTAMIYYRLNDPSNLATQHIQVEFMYYDSKSNINPGLLGSVVNKLDNILTGNLIDKSANPRPPLIIITRRN
jgi:hypothetical protein